MSRLVDVVLIARWSTVESSVTNLRAFGGGGGAAAADRNEDQLSVCGCLCRHLVLPELAQCTASIALSTPHSAPFEA